MARNKKVEILSNDKEVLHPMTDGDCVIFEDGQTLAQKLSEDDSVKYTPEIVNSSPMFKVGEGNTVDYSDNVLDGAYERATLQGQTYVNYIQAVGQRFLPPVTAWSTMLPWRLPARQPV